MALVEAKKMAQFEGMPSLDGAKLSVESERSIPKAVQHLRDRLLTDRYRLTPDKQANPCRDKRVYMIKCLFQLHFNV